MHPSWMTSSHFLAHVNYLDFTIRNQGRTLADNATIIVSGLTLGLIFAAIVIGRLVYRRNYVVSHDAKIVGYSPVGSGAVLVITYTTPDGEIITRNSGSFIYWPIPGMKTGTVRDVWVNPKNHNQVVISKRSGTIAESIMAMMFIGFSIFAVIQPLYL